MTRGILTIGFNGASRRLESDLESDVDEGGTCMDVRSDFCPDELSGEKYDASQSGGHGRAVDAGFRLPLESEGNVARWRSSDNRARTAARFFSPSSSGLKADDSLMCTDSSVSKAAHPYRRRQMATPRNQTQVVSYL